MNFRNLTKKQSGFFILIVYTFSFLIGYIALHFLVLNGYTSFIIALLIVDILMTIIIFIASLVTKNASFYDPYWSVTPIFLTLMCLLANTGFSQISLNQILIFMVILIWATRLTYNWWKNWSDFKKQDWRYDMLKEKTGNNYPLINFLGIHLFPTLIVFIQVININSIIEYNEINLLFIIGLLISLTAVILQQISDVQMYNYRMNKSRESQVINTGLWRFSRHPNYLGEILFWVGIYISYFSYIRVFDFNVLYPILMIFMFRFISIPMMERKLSSREGYSKYKSEVSPLFLLPNRSRKSN